MSLACPDCFSPLNGPRCTGCHRAFESDGGVLRLRAKDDAPAEGERAYLELYQARPDPWRYEGRAAEVLKAEAVMGVIDRLLRPGARVVEVGCATGHITRRLATRPISLVSFDLVPSAVVAAQRSLTPETVKADIGWCSANGAHLPVARHGMDLVLLLDGPVSWKLGPDGFDRVLSEALAALAPGGRVLVMDYMTPARFEELRGPV
ncbi:MAG: class I SAM-dependent methyltransferase, partial [Myxococcaceae bacterium]|nr:class I SAM-dependent methyltransferase [Myxococcaceae bacterium]